MDTEISSTAASNASAFFDAGVRKPDTLRTNWRAAARISWSVAGVGVRSVLMLLHIAKKSTPSRGDLETIRVDRHD